MHIVRRRGARLASVGALALGLAATGCGSSERRSADSARPATDTPSAAGARAQTSSSSAPSQSPVCARTGHWIPCQVHERLVRAGLAPRDTSRAELPSLGPAPVVYRLGKGALAVYLFADSAARARATTRLDTVKYVRGSSGPTMVSQAMVIENDNLLGLLFSKNDQQIERVSDALTAGPPQP